MFLDHLVQILVQYIRDENDRGSKVLDFHHPEEMQRLIDLSIGDAPVNLSSLLEVSKPFTLLNYAMVVRSRKIRHVCALFFDEILIKLSLKDVLYL